jgi:hypothetical protein
MFERRISIQGKASRGGSSASEDGKIRKSLRARSLALLGAAGLAIATIVSCRAGRNPDHSFFITFAPDMTITAWGLEDALEQLQDLYRQCLAGTWHRACTTEEEAAIERMHERILAVKQHLNRD